MEESIAAMESLLEYSFNNKSLLEEALTHPSNSGILSYERLEFLGDSALDFAIRDFFFFEYPDIEEGKLTSLRHANLSNEKLARVAVHHGFYKHIRYYNAMVLSDKVMEFALAVEEEEMVVHGGKMKAPKVLANIVESVAGAVYVDCGRNLQRMWTIFKRILEPLVMLDVILAQPQPITALFEACQKHKKQVEICYEWNGDRYTASVFVDDTFIASDSSLTKENAKLHAAEAALAKLSTFISVDISPESNVDDFNELREIEGAKQKVYQLCEKKKWQKPIYRVEQESGPSHDRKYAASVEVELSEMVVIKVKGNEKSRKRDAENSAALSMLFALQGDKNIASLFVDDTFIVSDSSLTKENAKLHAAETALAKLTTLESSVDGFNELTEIEGAKQKVCELCDKKKWQKPTYRLEQESGPSHDRKYVSCVEIEFYGTVIKAKGNEKSRKRDAENSAASNMLFALQKYDYV